MGESASPEAKDRPYFFLSYARPKYQSADRPELLQFFELLRRHVGNYTTTNPGFIDRQIAAGDRWSDDLAWALGNCHVFVPVLVDGYCDSVWCGKEWTGFSRRLQRLTAANGPLTTANGHSPTAIVPVLWAPWARCRPAPEVRPLQYQTLAFPQEYAAQGLYTLMVQPRYKKRHLYEETVIEIAKLIHAAGQQVGLPVSDPPDWDATPNAFADHQAVDDYHRIWVRLAACPATVAQSVPGRDFYYGPTMSQWMPYRVDGDKDKAEIAARAKVVIGDMSCRTVLDPLDDLVEPRPRPSPSVLLVDPWAPSDPETAATLSAIDSEDPARVVVPWNNNDDETKRNAQDLRTKLRETLPRSLSLPDSVKYPSDLAAFHFDFKTTVNSVIIEYRKKAPAYPPSEPASMTKPSLDPDVHGDAVPKGDADG